MARFSRFDCKMGEIHLNVWHKYKVKLPYSQRVGCVLGAFFFEREREREKLHSL